MFWDIRKKEKDYVEEVERIMEMISLLRTVKECGIASTYIDKFEEKYPKADCIGQLRNILSDLTFKLYQKNKKKIN
jgi:hypothetical protein